MSQIDVYNIVGQRKASDNDIDIFDYYSRPRFRRPQTKIRNQSKQIIEGRCFAGTCGMFALLTEPRLLSSICLRCRQFFFTYQLEIHCPPECFPFKRQILLQIRDYQIVDIMIGKWLYIHKICRVQVAGKYFKAICVVCMCKRMLSAFLIVVGQKDI